MVPESNQGKKQICRVQATLNPLLPRDSLGLPESNSCGVSHDLITQSTEVPSGACELAVVTVTKRVYMNANEFYPRYPSFTY